MRIPTTLRPALAAAALGSTLVLTACGGGGSASPDESGADESGAADSAGGGEYSIEQVRAAIEAVDVEGADFAVVDTSQPPTAGADGLDTDAPTIEPQECADTLAAAESPMEDADPADLVLATDSSTGTGVSGVAFGTADDVQTAITAAEDMISECATISIGGEDEDGAGDYEIEDAGIELENGVGYTMTTNSDGLGTMIGTLTAGIGVGNTYIGVTGSTTTNPDIEEQAEEILGQVKEHLESGA